MGEGGKERGRETSVVMAFFLAGRFSLMVVMSSSVVTSSVSYVGPLPAGTAASWAALPPSAATREPIRSQYFCRASS